MPGRAYDQNLLPDDKHLTRYDLDSVIVRDSSGEPTGIQGVQSIRRFKWSS
jgi:hypothetical protein